MKHPVRYRLTQPANLFAWLLIALVAGQGPLLALAECCGEGVGKDMASCCCAETSCKASATGDAATWARVASDCGCFERSVPLPYHDPNPPAERSEAQLRVLEPAAAGTVQPALENTDGGGHCSWPPGALASAHISVRTVVLLI